ncbi:DMT family transporter [Pollutimonas sp. M17]|uniref:DMT family transporter n=1 Tax=Pollutimonas sp. M17 TaxID=2962065 RepID=UPI0021F435DB|nr:DMT family transporter [Pollutimonas sp. M17]UYO94221.1 DMT family transporter [Pollutimonas sp. M17]
MGEVSKGWLNGLAGVAIFSGSLPATRVAIAGFDPVFLTAARAAIAGILALILLGMQRSGRPSSRDMASLSTVALGVVVGFPLLSALALQYITAARSLVFIGLLPLSTAIFGVIRGRERPRPAFWLFALLGSACVAGFALAQDADASWRGDVLMLGAILTCGYGYAEGGRLSRHMGGWEVISWALVLSLPFMAVISIVTHPQSWQQIGLPAWIGLGYVSLFSMLIGFFFWYRGLAQGGIAAVGQLQLLQPFMGLALAAALLGESVSGAMMAATIAVVACVAGARIFARK